VRKLYRFLVSEDEDPAPELLRPLAEELRGHNYDIGHVVSVILRSRHFYDPAARRQRVKGPVEFSAGLLRRWRCRGPTYACWPWPGLRAARQDLFAPPNVKGWDAARPG